MQKVTITATTLNDALNEVKKRFGEEAIIENTEEFDKEFRITVAITDEDKKTPIIVPNINKNYSFESRNFLTNSPLDAVRFIENICRQHRISDEFKEFWLDRLSPYLVLVDINLAESFSECVHFEQQWHRKILTEKPVVFLGTYGAGKTQSLAKLAAILKSSDRKVAIFNLDTIKASGQGMLESYAKKLDVPYYFGKNAWENLKANEENEKTIKLVDTSGINIQEPKDLEWLESYAKKFLFETVIVVPADTCSSQKESYINFIKKFYTTNIILTKIDISRIMGLPVEISWKTGASLNMINKSPNLGDALEYISPEKFLSILSQSIDLKKIGIKFH